MEVNKDGKLISSRTKKEVVIYDVNIAKCICNSNKNNILSRILSKIFKRKRSNYKNIIILNWDSNIGFGELTIIENLNGTYDCETETMCSNEDKLFIKAVLNKFIEKLNIIE